MPTGYGSWPYRFAHVQDRREDLLSRMLVDSSKSFQNEVVLVRKRNLKNCGWQEIIGHVLTMSGPCLDGTNGPILLTNPTAFCCESTVATKHNNPQVKPVVFESRLFRVDRKYTYLRTLVGHATIYDRGFYISAVVQWTAIEQENVSVFANFNASDSLFQTQHFGGCNRQRREGRFFTGPAANRESGF